VPGWRSSSEAQAVERGKQVTMFLIKDAVRLALPGYAEGNPVRRLVANAELGGTTPLWVWIGDEHATVFSY
jgi:hypothetical protein